MWVRMRFDIAWPDLGYGLRSVCLPLDRATLLERIRQYWSSPAEMFPCLSVRSGFDMLWGTLGFAPGSEVLMSALTIPDMPRILKHHELVPVPVDLEVGRMAPDVAAIERAITPATRAIVVAHLFGARFPMEPILQVARRHNLLVIEDCAQLFKGREYQGHPQADVAMFSFGPIKTATALGGAVFRIRDAELLRRMEALHETYPLQDRGVYLRRLLKYSVLKAAACRPVCDAVLSLCRMAELDHDHMISGAARGFAGPGFFDRIRHQPCAPLLAMLERRLHTFDPARVAERAARGRHLAGLLPAGTQRPGSKALGNTYWVFPILADDAPEVIAALAKAGFDAAHRGSLRVIAPPADRPDLEPRVTRVTSDKMVFLPICPQMPLPAIHRMARVLVRLNGQLTKRPIVAAGPQPASSLAGSRSAPALPQGALRV